MPRPKLLVTFEIEMPDGKKAKLKVHSEKVLQQVLTLLLSSEATVKEKTSSKSRATKSPTQQMKPHENVEEEGVREKNGIPIIKLSEPSDDGKLPEFVRDNPWLSVLSKRTTTATV